jgi:hypothetical protein
MKLLLLIVAIVLWAVALFCPSPLTLILGILGFGAFVSMISC